MTLDLPRCPLCGQMAIGTRELVPGLALLVFDENGQAEYAGETRIDWNSQATQRDDEGRVTLECPHGHQWPSPTDEPPRLPKEGPAFNERGELEISDGGCLEPPSLEDPAIRRRDKDGNLEEVRQPGDDDYDEWSALFGFHPTAAPAWRNHYQCPNCGHPWADEWDSQCDDDCPACGTRHISPHTSEEIT